jgi:uroporphyrinogen-III synthase
LIGTCPTPEGVRVIATAGSRAARRRRATRVGHPHRPLADDAELLAASRAPTVQPLRSRLGAMVRRLEGEMLARSRSLPVAGHWVELRGHAVVVDGALRELPPNGMSLLRALVRRPGRIVSRAELLGRGVDENAVETAMARLRAAQGNPTLVQAVMKHGYRLALEPAAGPVPLGGHCLHGDVL